MFYENEDVSLVDMLEHTRLDEKLFHSARPLALGLLPGPPRNHAFSNNVDKIPFSNHFGFGFLHGGVCVCARRYFLST